VKLKGFVFAAIAVLSLTSAVFPGENLVIKLFVTTAKLDSPVEVVGFKYPERGPDYPDRFKNDNEGFCLMRGYCPKVVLHNRTKKEVTAIDVGGLYGNPAEPQETAEHLSQMGVLSVDNLQLKSLHVIAANGQAEFGSIILWPYEAIGMGIHQWGSSCVHVAVVVTHVKFSDGTEWMYDYRQGPALWRDSIPSGTVGSCRTSPEASAALKSIGGVGPESLPSQLSNETIDSYSAICPVKKNSDGWSALVCTW